MHPELLQRLRHALQRVSPEVLSGRVLEVLNCDARNDLRRTTVPLLYLDAINDKLVSSECKKEFFRLRPDTLLTSIPAPHLLLQREPQKAVAIMMAFINGLTPSPG
jgi:hypothetical protein